MESEPRTGTTKLLTLRLEWAKKSGVHSALTFLYFSYKEIIGIIALLPGRPGAAAPAAAK